MEKSPDSSHVASEVTGDANDVTIEDDFGEFGSFVNDDTHGLSHCQSGEEFGEPKPQHTCEHNDMKVDGGNNDNFGDFEEFKVPNGPGVSTNDVVHIFVKLTLK